MGDETELKLQQMALLELAIRQKDGDPIAASAHGFGTFTRWSLEFQIDPLDLFNEVQQLIADHLRKRAEQNSKVGKR